MNRTFHQYVHLQADQLCYMWTRKFSRPTTKKTQLLLHPQIPTLEIVYRLKRCAKGIIGLYSIPRLFKFYAGYHYSSGRDRHFVALPECNKRNTQNTPHIAPQTPQIQNSMAAIIFVFECHSLGNNTRQSKGIVVRVHDMKANGRGEWRYSSMCSQPRR